MSAPTSASLGTRISVGATTTLGADGAVAAPVTEPAHRPAARPPARPAAEPTAEPTAEPAAEPPVEALTGAPVEAPVDAGAAARDEPAPATGLFRIHRGHPGPEELAAVAVVLACLVARTTGAGARHTDIAPHRPRPRSRAGAHGCWAGCWACR
ncbi:acyl-CoA carboxylase epsilon subunit [Streptomyces sp. NPDC048606]|uniref:acyl-CoA carboxylase epsilon subunit n=1 Tax=Streptomyces sp. NPDC048606 TaxID=3154726 RepID=UPI0034245ABA